MKICNHVNHSGQSTLALKGKRSDGKCLKEWETIKAESEGTIEIVKKLYPFWIINSCFSWYPQCSHSKITFFQCSWPLLSTFYSRNPLPIFHGSGSGSAWGLQLHVKTITLAPKPTALFSTSADFPVPSYHSPFTGLGSEKTQEQGAGESVASSKGQSAGEQAKQRKGSRALYWLSLERITPVFYFSQNWIKLAIGSKIQGLCSSNQHWKFCSPVGLSESQTRFICFCFNMSSPVFIAAVSLNSTLLPLQLAPTLFLGIQSSFINWGVCTYRHTHAQSSMTISVVWMKKPPESKLPFHNIFFNNLRLSLFPPIQLITKKDV